jgi:insecticidal toxin complex protein TccC
VTDASGVVVHRAAYQPYGADRQVAGSFAPKRQWNFKEKDADGYAHGLYDYGARMYNPATGRWLSPDTSTKDGLNRFAYVSNNPQRFVDPDGHEEHEAYIGPREPSFWEKHPF